MQRSYDVAIIGAGPSGSSASLSAVMGGAETLLLERKREIGLPVKCGEFLPSLNEIKKLMLDASSHTMDRIKAFYSMISKEVVTNKTRRIRVYSPNNKTYEFEFDGLVLKRDVFDKKLASEAVELGVKLQTSCAVRAIVDKSDIKEILVNSSQGKYFVKTKLVIGADGFPSNVAKWGKLENGYRPKNVALCVQQRMKNVKVENDVVEIYFGTKYAPGGFAWIIPKGDEFTNVGLGVRLTYLSSMRFLLHYFNAFLKRHPTASRRFQRIQRQSSIVKTLPVGGQVRRVCGNRVMLAGDAAGTVIPINGAGILTAILSGHLAGQVASRYLNGDCELSTYATVLKRDIGGALKRGFRYRKVADIFAYSDSLFEKILQLIGTKNMAKVLKCEPLSADLIIPRLLTLV